MLENLKSFIPFWNFFNGLPSKHQLGYVVLVGVLIFYTVFCLNIKYEVKFEIRSNFDNTLIKKPVTIVLDQARRRRNFDTKTGKHSDRYFAGKYVLSVKPDESYKLVEPGKITVNKYSEESEVRDPELIYLNFKQPLRNRNDSDTKSIEPSAPKIVQTAHEEVTLYTIIKSLQSSGNRPLEGLTIGNFSVLEQYRGINKKAEILDLKALQASSLNVVLVVDVSGSMQSHIGQAQAAIKRFIQEIKSIRDRGSSSGRISVLLVRGESASSNNFLKPHGQSIWLPFNDQNLNYLIDDLDKLKAEGNTPLYDSLRLATEQLVKFDESSYNVIVCLSDGEDNRSRTSSEDISILAQRSQIPIFSIVYGSTMENSLKLRQFINISRESGAGGENIGSFINSEISQLQNLFSRIASSIEKAYELRWKTEASVGDDVDVAIRVAYQGSESLFKTEIKKSYRLKPLPIQPVK
jgi:Mg-chelatase subunit ChlD